MTLERLPYPDTEPDLNALLGHVGRKKLSSALQALLGTSMRLTDTRGVTVLGGAGGSLGRKRVPLVVQLEPIGYLEGDDEAVLGQSAVLVQEMLKSAQRYHLAAAFHAEVVDRDYEALQSKHRALQASEARYRQLAASLEQRVQEQVKTIENAQRQLYQAEKLASVGQLAAGIAHEINNPIAFIRSNLNTALSYVEEITEFLQPGYDTLKDGVTPDINCLIQDFMSLLRESIDGTERVARIVSDLKDYSGIDRDEEEVLDINQIIQSIVNVASAQFNDRAVLELQLGRLPAIRCRPGYLGQVFMNILLNAVEAVAEGHGRIGITSVFREGAIAVAISDNGVGMSQEVMARVFDPFYSTREVGAGTGLGLTVSLDIVRSHGGRIEVRSAPREGTTFTIILPLRN